MILILAGLKLAFLPETCTEDRNMKFLSRLLLCFIISFTLIELPITKAHAGMISTTEAIAEMTRTQGENTVNAFLSRSDVKDQLVKLGVSPEEAQKRIASLSESEVKKLATDIEKAQIGGDVGGILVVVLLVILIIYFAKRI